MTDPAGPLAPRSSVRPLPGRLHVNIVGIDNGAGLTVDARLLVGVLRSAGMTVEWSKASPSRTSLRLHRIVGRHWPAPHVDVNVFLERCNPAWLPLGRHNVLIPNPEWFMPDQAALLGRLDAVLCKTLDAQRTFGSLQARTRWIGFTAEDRWGGALAASDHRLRALHVAGRSEHKGTAAVVAAWSRHPEWPLLTVVRRPLEPGGAVDLPPLPNVRYLTQRLTDEELLALQREHPLYVLPSEVEGYGQSLVEGLAVGAVVVTTDAPPMNELIRPDRGVLVPARAGEACRLGRLYHVEAQALEIALGEVLSWPSSRRESVGRAARQWFVDNDRRFREELPAVLREIATGPAAG